MFIIILGTAKVMLNVIILQEGVFEISDADLVGIRYRNFQRLNFLRTMMYVLIVTALILLVLSLVSSLFFILGLPVIGIGIYFAFTPQDLLKESLDLKIGQVLLQYDKDKNLSDLRVRKWARAATDQYTEEKIRHNQAIGFRVKWDEEGLYTIELIVDRDFAGTPIFHTYDFQSIAECVVFFEVAMPGMTTWQYQLVDGSDWPQKEKDELNEEIQLARVPWQVRDFFDSPY